MISMVPTGNDGTTGLYWVRLKTNWNNGYHLYCNNEVGANMVNSEVKYQGSLMT